MLENTKKKIKATIAGILAAVAVVIPSVRYAQKRLEAPDKDREKEETKDDTIESYDKVLDDIGVEIKETLAFNEPEIIKEEITGNIVSEDITEAAPADISIKEENVETKVTETNVQESPVDTEKVLSEETAEASVTENDIQEPVEEDIYKLDELKTILDNKTYEDSMKKVIVDTYIKLYNEYDKVYSYKKIAKADYLSQFLETIDKSLNTAELVEEKDSNEEYALLLKKLNSVGLAKNDTIYIKENVDFGVEANLLHEIEHLNTYDLTVKLGCLGVDLDLVVKEGMSSRVEEFCGVLPGVEEILICGDTPGKTISIVKDVTVSKSEDGSLTQTYSPYSTYENMMERIETLVGMEKLNDIINSKGDFVGELRKELSTEFSKEAVDDFVTNFIVSSMLLDNSTIAIKGNIQGKFGMLLENIQRNTDLLNTKPEELEGRLKSEITQLENQIQEYETLKKNTEKNEKMTDSEKNEYLILTELLIQGYAEKLELKKADFENYNYEDKVDELAFEIKADEKKMKLIESYGKDRYQAALDTFSDLENSFNDLMVERIENVEDKADIGELKAATVNYYENILISCTDDYHITKDNFKETVVQSLQEKAKELNVELDLKDSMKSYDFDMGR